MNARRAFLKGPALALLAGLALAAFGQAAEKTDARALARQIDRFIDTRLKEEGVPASPRADDAEFCRRVYLDLTGRIPSAEEAANFLDSKDPDKRDVLGLGTGQRNIAAATVVASQGFSDPKTLVMVVITSLVGLSILFPIAAQLREREAERTQARAPYEKGLVATRTGRPSSTQRGLERPSAPNSSPISG